MQLVPYPLPIVPVPGLCPCYLVEPSANGTAGNASAPTPPPYRPPPQYGPPAQQPAGLPPYAFIGFIPVIFYPYCPGNGSDPGQMLQPMFPSAVLAPYPCSQCGSGSGEQLPPPTLARFDPSSSFGRVLDLANIPLTSVVRAPHRRVMKRRHRVLPATAPAL